MEKAESPVVNIHPVIVRENQLAAVVEVLYVVIECVDGIGCRDAGLKLGLLAERQGRLVLCIDLPVVGR